MGNFLKNLKKAFSAPAFSSANFISFKIKCDRCGEEIMTNIRTSSDISSIYDEEDAPQEASYFIRKEILGNKCNNLIYLTAYFGPSYNLISCDVTGGKIIEK